VQEKQDDQAKKQVTVYFVSEVLSPSKKNYTELEKVLYTILMASRKLRHYFQTYHIVGVSDLGVPQPRRPVNLSLRAPAQMGWRKMEHKGECGLYYLAPGVCS
jgi:hypothetical protein